MDQLMDKVDSEERSAACPLDKFSKEDLIRLIGDYSKTWLALDGVWFQSVEQADGMEAAMFHDARAWERFTVIEAKRIKSFLGLEERPGLDGLERALSLRFYANINEATFKREDGKLIYMVKRVRPFCRRLLYMIPVCAAVLPRLRFTAAFGTICLGETYGACED